MQDFLGSEARYRTLAPGACLFDQGDEPMALYQVQSGFVKLTRAQPAGKEAICELLLPGDVFDLPSCLDGRPYPLSCKAPTTTSVELAWVPRSLVVQDNALRSRCQGRLIEQLRQQRECAVASAYERVEVRLARALVWLAVQLGTRVGERVTLPLWMTRQEIAEWVGTTTETVIRLCSDLRRRGLIDLGKGHLTLVNPSGMLQLSAAA